MAKCRVSSSFARSISFTLCLALIFSSLPFAASSQNQSPETGLRTQGPPSPNVPSIDAIRSAQPREVNLPAPTRAKRCRHFDRKCKELKEKKAENRLAPANNYLDALLAHNHSRTFSPSFDWRTTKAGLLPELDLLLNNALHATSNSAEIGESNSTETSHSNLPRAFANSLAPVTALQVTNFETARMDAHNRTGAPGEDLFSGNFNWTLPLVSLPGRAGHDLNLSLSYNSLVWLKWGSYMRFDPDYGWPSPGFRLGFPTFVGPYVNSLTNRVSYQLITPSGGVVELRQVNSITWDAEDSSYTRLSLNGSGNYVLTTADGTQYIYGDTLEIKDRNGNRITVSYTEFGLINTITDTLGRVITFNYGEFYELLSITQVWNGITKMLAVFHYADQAIYTNFSGLYLDNVTNGQLIPVVYQIDLLDQSRYMFQYNTYAQVTKFERYRGQTSNPTLLRSWISYNLPPNAQAGAQTDCPRFTQRTDMAYDWSAGVTTNFSFDSGGAWGQVTTPDGTVQKQFFATTGWQRGLPTTSETWTGGVKKKWTELQWEQACAGTYYPCNPRVYESNIYDDTDGNGTSDNRRRVTTSFTSFNLPFDVYEYDSNATTVLRRTRTEYNLTTTYTNRRIIGLPSRVTLYDGASAEQSKVEFFYDEGGYLQATSATPTGHDSTNYGIGFVAGRGNQTSVRRYDVGNQSYVEWKTGYNITGSPTFSRDPLYGTTAAQVAISYDDKWVNASGNDAPNLNTFAYPTTITDQDNYSTTIKYNFDIGAVRRTINPKGASVLHEYDGYGRRWRTTNEVNGAYTYFTFDSMQSWIASYSTIEAGQGEFLTVTTFDGHDRVRGVLRDHPGSAGGYSAQYFFYDTMGRTWQQSNPTETNANWVPTGDDAAGWAWSLQEYDWQGRPTFSYNQDHTAQNESKREVSYTGCGCAGGDVITIKGEITSGQDKRTQKIWRDILGRTVKSQILNYNGTPYTTTLTEYNLRDQATVIKTFKGDAAIGANCPLGNCEQTELVYDGHGRLQKRYLPIYQNDNVAPPYSNNSSARNSNVQYYNDDRVHIETDPRGATATYTYNNRKLVSGISYTAPSGVASKPSVSFGYDQLGVRSSMSDGAGTATYNINNLGQIESETRQFTMSGAPTGYFTVNYEYGLAGQLKMIRDPFNDQINYGYDKTGRLLSVTGSAPFAGVTNYLSGVQYRAWGALKNNRSYDIRLRLISSGLINYQYNRAGDMTYADMTTLSPYHQTFGYDHVGRLTSISTPEISAPTEYICTTCSVPPGFNGLPPNTKVRPFTTSIGYDEFDNVTNTNSNYWHDIAPNLAASPQVFTTTYVNGRAKKDGVAGKVYNNRDEVWTYNAMGQVTYDTRTGQTFDAAGQMTRSDNGPNIYINYAYDGDGRQVKFDQKREDGTTELRYRIYSAVLGGLLTDINSSGEKVETRVYRFIYEQDTVRQVKAYSVPNGGNPPLNVPDTVVFEGSDPHGTRATVWDRNTNTYKTATLAAPGAYIEDINWQGLKDRYVANIGSQVAYGQYAASQYQSSYFSNIDPRNPGTGCSLDGQKVQCDKLFRAANNGGLKSITFSTTGGSGGVGGDTGALAAAFGLAAGTSTKAAAARNQARIAGERVSLTIQGETTTWDTPLEYSNAFDSFWGIGAGFGITGGQIINDKSGTSTSACGRFVKGIVKVVDSSIKANESLTQLGEYFFIAAGIAEKLGKKQPFDGFQEIHTGKANANVGQKWAVYQHVYGFIAASLFLDKALPEIVRKRTGAKTGLELAEKQLKEDYDQFDHPEKHKGHPREEAAQEIANDIAGIAAGNLIRERYNKVIDNTRLRQLLFGLFCDH